MNRQELYNHLKDESKVLDNDTIAGAFAAVDRKLFVEPDYEPEAYEDYAVPIGFGTVIPQPTKTAFMIELLEPRPGDHILIVGSGSGWSAALIAHCIGAEGKIVGVEIIPELVRRSQVSLERAGIGTGGIAAPVEIITAGSELGAPEHAPFDRIICFASAPELPGGLLAQLSLGGTLVIPIGEELYRVRKTGDFDFEDESFPDVEMEPLIVSSGVAPEEERFS